MLLTGNSSVQLSTSSSRGSVPPAKHLHVSYSEPRRGAGGGRSSSMAHLKMGLLVSVLVFIRVILWLIPLFFTLAGTQHASTLYTSGSTYASGPCTAAGNDYYGKDIRFYLICSVPCLPTSLSPYLPQHPWLLLNRVHLVRFKASLACKKRSSRRASAAAAGLIA
jgi:hypothetical protein